MDMICLYHMSMLWMPAFEDGQTWEDKRPLNSQKDYN